MNEKLIQRKLRARRKFKQIARCVIRNLYWLMDSDDMQIGDNVKQNITLIYSGKRKKSGGITLEEKCLLRKPAKWRTREEKIRLYRSLGGLKCFRHWPDHVKFKLVSCTYFVFYDEDRIIVKQNRRAEALYFILSGQVNVLQEVVAFFDFLYINSCRPLFYFYFIFRQPVVICFILFFLYSHNFFSFFTLIMIENCLLFSLFLI